MNRISLFSPSLNLSDFGEKVLNPSKNCFSFFIAKLNCNPFDGIFVVLAIVTSSVAMASRNYIGRYGSRASITLERQEVIHSQSVKQSSRATAVSTTAAKIVESKSPIAFCKISRKGCLSGNIVMVSDPQPLKVFFSVLSATLLLALCVFFSPGSHPFLALFGGVASFLSQAFFVFCSVLAGFLAKFFLIFFSPLFAFLSNGFLVCLAVGCLRFLAPLNVAAIPLRFSRVIARLAYIAEPIFFICSSIKVFRGGRFFFHTLATALVSFASGERNTLSESSARYADAAETIKRRVVPMKVILGDRKPFMARGAHLQPFRLLGDLFSDDRGAKGTILVVFPLHAGFALGMKPIFLGRLAIEVLCCCWKKSIALGALLRGNILGHGIIGHVISASSADVQAGNIVEMLPGISIGFTPVIISQNGGIV